MEQTGNEEEGRRARAGLWTTTTTTTSTTTPSTPPPPNTYPLNAAMSSASAPLPAPTLPLHASPLRVAIIAENFLPKIDGSTITLAHLLAYLHAAGVRAMLFGPESGMREYAGAQLFGAAGVPLRVYPGLKINFISPAFLSALRAFRPHVIHIIDPIWLGVQLLALLPSSPSSPSSSSSSHSSSSPLAFFSSLFPHTPIVTSHHTNLPTYAAVFGYPYWHHRTWALQRFFHSHYARFTLVPSASCASLLRERGWERLRVCSRGVDRGAFNPAHRTPTLRAAWGCTPSDVVLLSVGRLSPEKNLALLVAAFAALPERVRERAKLIFIGAGPFLPTLRTLCAAARVRAVFTGELTGERLGAAFACGDVFCAPSITETFGQVTLQAMASGLPVVGLYVEGTADLVRCESEEDVSLDAGAGEGDDARAGDAEVGKGERRKESKENGRNKKTKKRRKTTPGTGLLLDVHAAAEEVARRRREEEEASARARAGARAGASGWWGWGGGGGCEEDEGGEGDWMAGWAPLVRTTSAGSASSEGTAVGDADNARTFADTNSEPRDAAPAHAETDLGAEADLEAGTHPIPAFAPLAPLRAPRLASHRSCAAMMEPGHPAYPEIVRRYAALLGVLVWEEGEGGEDACSDGGGGGVGEAPVGEGAGGGGRGAEVEAEADEGVVGGDEDSDTETVIASPVLRPKAKGDAAPPRMSLCVCEPGGGGGAVVTEMNAGTPPLASPFLAPEIRAPGRRRGEGMESAQREREREREIPRKGRATDAVLRATPAVTGGQEAQVGVDEMEAQELGMPELVLPPAVEAPAAAKDSAAAGKSAAAPLPQDDPTLPLPLRRAAARRAAMGARALAASEAYRWERCAGRILETYIDAVTGDRTPRAYDYEGEFSVYAARVREEEEREAEAEACRSPTVFGDADADGDEEGGGDGEGDERARLLPPASPLMLPAPASPLPLPPSFAFASFSALPPPVGASALHDPKHAHAHAHPQALRVFADERRELGREGAWARGWRRVAESVQPVVDAAAVVHALTAATLSHAAYMVPTGADLWEGV
ncbi:hypothetical protein B0H11DRAFT_2283061 [Mycena galericulata]|nr:hypothetical protein B0H11DRAFT_2283061 [Mycena galericulata]